MSSLPSRNKTLLIAGKNYAKQISKFSVSVRLRLIPYFLLYKLRAIIIKKVACNSWVMEDWVLHSCVYVWHKRFAVGNVFVFYFLLFPYDVSGRTSKIACMSAVSCCCRHVWPVSDVLREHNDKLPCLCSEISFVSAWYGTCFRKNSNGRSRWVCWILLFNHWKLYISTKIMHMVIKLSSVLTYHEELHLTHKVTYPFDHVVLWDHETNQNHLFPLLQCLLPPKLVGWWHYLRGS